MRKYWPVFFLSDFPIIELFPLRKSKNNLVGEIVKNIFELEA